MALLASANRLKPYLLMVFLQFGFAGLYVISIASLKKGISHFVLVAYRNAFALACIAPFALWFERKTRPKMTPAVFFKVLAMALLEPVLDQNLYYMGTNYTSASFTAAIINILPAVTFLMATILRIENVNIRRRSSQAKIIGTLITVGGVVLMIVYKGVPVALPWTNVTSHVSADVAVQDEKHWIIGTFMLLGSCICWSAFFILQANTLKSYPAGLSLATLICLMGALESTSVAFVMERGIKPWLIGFDTRLFGPAYSGVVCSGITYYIQGIIMKERGPVFVTAFQPLCMIIVAILGSIILAEQITSGRVVGAVIIVIGLYFLIWGEGKDHLAVSSENEKLPVAADATGKKVTTAHIAIVDIPAIKTP